MLDAVCTEQKSDMTRRIAEDDFHHPSVQSIAYSFCSQIRTCWYRVILAAAVLVMAPLFILASRSPAFTTSQQAGWEDVSTPSILEGTMDYIEATQVVWQIPSSPKAVLFIAHGCHCRPTFFWDKSSTCMECIGLPEERAIVIHALTKGYAVIAISSTRECWAIRDDKTKVLSILSSWIHDKGLENLPVVALGASSGGFFISALAEEYKFSSQVIMISEGKFRSIKIDADYPPTLFVHMVKDKRRAALIKDAMELLRSNNIETAEVKCYQLPVTAELFMRIPGMDSKTSGRIYYALKWSRLLDSNSIMTVDGRFTNWMKPLKRRSVMPERNLRKWELHLQELLNVAYGFHEMTSSQTSDIFDWFDEHLPKDVL